MIQFGSRISPDRGSQPMDHVFISYARTDIAFVRKLNAALEAAGHETRVDWEGIEPSANWTAKIEGAIDAAKAVVFVISPKSCASTVCGQELDHAIHRNKRRSQCCTSSRPASSGGQRLIYLTERGWLVSKTIWDTQRQVEAELAGWQEAVRQLQIGA